jgi:acyl-CoA reductase-like NAD-dependent aldehyde dehydrogenase
MTRPSDAVPALVLPTQRGLYYGGLWREAASRQQVAVENPGTGECLARVATAGEADIRQ